MIEKSGEGQGEWEMERDKGRRTEMSGGGGTYMTRE